MALPSPLTHEDWKQRAAGIKHKARLFIDGDSVNAADGRCFESINPANNVPVCSIARGGAADVDLAVGAAKRAFRSGIWSRIAPRERLETLYRFADLIEREATELSLLDSVEMGKPVSDMMTIDIPEIVKTLRYFAEAIDKVEGTTTATESDVLHYTLRQPLGVVGAISPWNYPLLMAMWKVAPALAAGNTAVLKPSEAASLSCLRAAELFVEAGGPPGVFNVVSGYGTEAGEALALHMDVSKISFTGSTAVGRKMLAYAGQSNLKKVGLECGGKSPQIFCRDLADLDRAVTSAIDGIFANMGEVCNAGSRLLVERPIYADFLARFAELAEGAYQPGDPLDPATTLGPLVDRNAQVRVQAAIEAAGQAGARAIYRGTVPDHLADGAYIAPTAFADVRNDMSLARDEIFGPVAAIIPFDDPDEALAIANDSVYGLAAGLWTQDLSLAHRLVKEIEAGVVWVNSFNDGDMTQPFGGWKQSGNSRDKCFESLLEYTQIKSAWFRI